MQRSIRAVVTDLDGTLFNRQYRPSERTLRVMNVLRQRGVIFILATGRAARDVFESVREHNMAVDYIITNNGAAIYHCAQPVDARSPTGLIDAQQTTFTCVRAHTITPHVVKQLFAVPVAVGPAEGEAASSRVPLVATNMFKGESWLTTCKVGKLGQSYRPSCQPCVIPDLASQDVSFFENVIQVFFYGPHEHLLDIKASLPERFPHWKEQMEFSFSLPHILDITAPGIHKGVAVEEVCALLGLAKDETIAFGDGMNDLAMLEAAGHACVVSNAMPALKEALPRAELIGHHDEDAVADKLCALFGITE